MSSEQAGRSQREGFGDISLLQQIDPSQLICLNEAPDHTIKSILRSDGVASAVGATSDAYLISDADEQLLLNITFKQAVRLRSIVIRTADASLGPKNIKLFINKPNLAFDDVESATAKDTTQSIALSEEDVSQGKVVVLTYVRFQTVHSLHIFVESNQGGGDVTRIDGLDFIGTVKELAKDLSTLGREEE